MFSAFSCNPPLSCCLSIDQRGNEGFTATANIELDSLKMHQYAGSVQSWTFPYHMSRSRSTDSGKPLLDCSKDLRCSRLCAWTTASTWGHSPDGHEPWWRGREVGVGALWNRSDGSCKKRETRSCHWPGRRSLPNNTDTLSKNEEQPCAYWCCWCRQNGNIGGPRTTYRKGRCTGEHQKQACGRPWPRPAHCRS